MREGLGRVRRLRPLTADICPQRGGRCRRRFIVITVVIEMFCGLIMQQVPLLSIFTPPTPTHPPQKKAAFLFASALLEVTHCLITAASAAEGVRGWLRADGGGVGGGGGVGWGGVQGRLTRRHVIIVVRQRRGGTLTHVTDSQPRPHV